MKIHQHSSQLFRSARVILLAFTCVDKPDAESISIASVVTTSTPHPVRVEICWPGSWATPARPEQSITTCPGYRVENTGRQNGATVGCFRCTCKLYVELLESFHVVRVSFISFFWETTTNSYRVTLIANLRYICNHIDTNCYTRIVDFFLLLALLFTIHGRDVEEKLEETNQCWWTVVEVRWQQSLSTHHHHYQRQQQQQYHVYLTLITRKSLITQ